ncbi:MAG: hypothetical protein J5535_04720, partial [Firmicutes bacterium]|nr:hypothetical protein [Bacillota bacterium]
MKKILAIILTAALVIGLAACGTANNNTPDTGSNTSNSAPAAPPDGGTPPAPPDGRGGPGGNGQGGPGGQTSVNYSAAEEITADMVVSGKEYSSETADENALSVSGDAEVSL